MFGATPEMRERNLQMLHRREAGATYAQIGQEFGVSGSHARYVCIRCVRIRAYREMLAQADAVGRTPIDEEAIPIDDARPHRRQRIMADLAKANIDTIERLHAMDLGTLRSILGFIGCDVVVTAFGHPGSTDDIS